MTASSKSPSLNYKDAGVNIDAGNALVERIKSVAQKTRLPGVIAGLGGFGALFELPTGYQEPVLVSGTDGVGTKLRLALDLNQHDQIGIDLVAMCVNDLIVAGAKPLFFLDYYATGKLSLHVAADVVTGIGTGCELSGISLVGGETAEMPGMYADEDYDLAGFCVGIVEKSKILDGSNVRAGDRLIGLPSSGPHANGFSLIRKILEVANATLADDLEGKPLSEWLMAPTRIYVKSVLELLEQIDVHALSHITGGGLLENLPRVMQPGTAAIIDSRRWQPSPIFHWLQNQGNVSSKEMYRTFNCGVGMVIVVAREDESATLRVLEALGEAPFVMGEIKANGVDPNAKPTVIIEQTAFSLGPLS